MTAPNLSYSLEYWQQIDPHDRDVPNLATPNVQSYEKVSQHFMAHSGFPLVLQGEPDAWALENYDWSGEMALKSSSDFVQNWQLYDGPYTATMDGEKNLNMTSDSWIPEYQTPTSPYARPDQAENQHLLSRIAAERALFMTPSVHALSVSTFPGSPVSDHSSTPEIPQAPFSRGGTEQARDTSPFPDMVSEHNSTMQGPIATAWMANGPTWNTEDEDFPTMLEMPDGSSRKTSNWLPVDPEAGFTIGSSSYPDGVELHMGGLDDIRGAFIPSTSAQWAHTG
ncbi:hypothetical protein N7466_008442 [Penicillium verhagenii]|uniref:uncharacterized protein n=1 Tax=Penicillium verhagenii TaxID=1562060 RepID=UPI002544DBFC|nr:uncharacterized protein N7466_008442 [Penicillium verhagenii]KAJ5924255.1 hypothetical protein N7466_008442 [Penicillium verhagenii]